MPKAEAKHFYSWLGEALEVILEKRSGKKCGYCLLVFAPEQKDGASDYISNVNKSNLTGILQGTANHIGEGKKRENIKRNSPLWDDKWRVKPEIGGEEGRVKFEEEEGRVKFEEERVKPE